MATESSNQNNPAGVYRHPETGAEQVIEHDPITGSALADAFVRVGFVFVGDVQTETSDQAKQDKKEDKK